MKERELYSIDDARFLLGGISRVSMYRLLNDGELATVVIGGRRLVPAAAIHAFIATHSAHDAPSEKRARAPHRSVQMSLQLEPAQAPQPPPENRPGALKRAAHHYLDGGWDDVSDLIVFSNAGKSRLTVSQTMSQATSK